MLVLLSSIVAAMLTDAERGRLQTAFWAWFRSSRVVDDQGRPLIVYHGTPVVRDFAEFSVEGPPWVEDEELGELVPVADSSKDPNAYMGAHFTGDPRVASRFAEGLYRSGREYEGPAGPRVYPVYLSIQNPKRMTEDELIFLTRSQPIDDEVLLREAIRVNDWDVSSEDDVDHILVQYDDEDSEDLREQLNLEVLNLWQVREDEDLYESVVRQLGEQAREELRAQGYDGVVYENVVEGGGDSYIAFSPEQIKSAIGSGFDPERAEIVYGGHAAC